MAKPEADVQESGPEYKERGAARGKPVVLVTGASRGIGRGIALSLAEERYSVAINYAGNRAAAEETKSACERLAAGRASDPGRSNAMPDTRADPNAAVGADTSTHAHADSPANEPRYGIFQANVGERADRERMVEEVFDSFGRLDALVNNAGIAPRERRDILEATEESFEEVIRVNLQGPYFLTQSIVRRWQAAAGGESLLPAGFKVVFVSSISAHTVSFNRGEYCVSKAGMAMAAQLWAGRLAGEGVQVFEVRPGIMKTDLTSKVRDKYDSLISEGLVPQRRWGTPDDMGRSVRALVRGDFPFSTGSVIDVDGGFQIRRL